MMVAGRDKDGDSIHDDSTISKSALRDAATSASEFLVTDTSQSEQLAQPRKRGRAEPEEHHLYSAAADQHPGQAG